MSSSTGTNEMNDIDRMLIEHECRKLMLLYCQHVDHLDPEAFSNLFAEDAYYNPAAHPEMNGRSEILAWAKAYPRNRRARHLSTNQVVEVIDADNAKGTSYAVVFRQEDPVEGIPSGNVVPRAVVEYHDTFCRTKEGWRIATREYQYIFLNDNGSELPRQ
jgi:hypothetical protein